MLTPEQHREALEAIEESKQSSPCHNRPLVSLQVHQRAVIEEALAALGRGDTAEVRRLLEQLQ